MALARAWGETAVIAAWGGSSSPRLLLDRATVGPGAAGILSVSALIPVTTVVIARLRANREHLRNFYLSALHTAYVGVSPLMALVAVGGSVVIPIVFGPGWSPSVVPFQFLAVAGIFALGAALDHGVMYGVGRPGLWFAYSVITDAVTLATTVVLVQYGLPAIALGFVVVTIAATLGRWWPPAAEDHRGPGAHDSATPSRDGRGRDSRSGRGRRRHGAVARPPPGGLSRPRWHPPADHTRVHRPGDEPRDSSGPSSGCFRDAATPPQETEKS